MGVFCCTRHHTQQCCHTGAGARLRITATKRAAINILFIILHNIFHRKSGIRVVNRGCSTLLLVTPDVSASTFVQSKKKIYVVP